jgi:hypothetical protein
VLNAYLQPIMEGYLTSLEERLLATGYTHGVLTVASSGGMMTTDTARRLPIKTIFSGPAGGVSQACFVGAAVGIRDFITYDMGGTSTDVCLVRDLQPLMTAGNWVPELISIAGGQACLAETEKHSGYVSWEQIRSCQPEVVVVAPCGFDLPRTIQEASVLMALPGWHELPAVRGGRCFAIDGNAYLNRSGPRLVESLEILAHLIQPELFAAPQLADGTPAFASL